MGKGLKGSSNGGTAGASQVDDLKVRILASEPGTGDVARHIQEAKFSPRRNAFTSLIQVASKSRQPEKAIEIFEAMKTVAGIPPNTYSYSALISALARVGQWEQAEQYFNELKELARDGDPDMQLNTVTYAAMISAYEKGGQLQKALDVFEEQIKWGVEPDVITYASLVNACEKVGDIEQGLSLIDQMHKKGFAGSQQMYMGMIAACGKSWEKALEVFLGMQCAGVQITPQCVNVMMGCLCAANQNQPALHLLQQAAEFGWVLSPMAYISLMRLLANDGLYHAADYVYSIMLHCGFFPDATTAGMLIYAHATGGDRNGAFQLELHFKGMAILPVTFKPDLVKRNVENDMLLRFRKPHKEERQSPRSSERLDSGSTSSGATCTSDVRNDEDS